MQRMYFQCDPDEDVDAWSDDRIWAELQARLAGANGYTLQEGPITDKTVLRFRSFVCEPMRYGRLLLAGDAAHTVPPTGAKGLNLALADVRVLAEVLERAVAANDRGALDEYTDRALARVWKAQHFSYWMTTMLHTGAGRHRLRRTPAAGRAGVGRRFPRRLDLPRRGLHRLACLGPHLWRGQPCRRPVPDTRSPSGSRRRRRPGATG